MRLLQVSLLRARAFRQLALGVLWNSVGTVGEQVVLGWLTLELTDSPLMVGIALGMRMAPLLIIGIPAGVIADRADRHRLLRTTSGLMAAATAVLGLLALFHVVAVWHLLLLTFAAGCVRAVNQTARQSYAHDLVGAGELVNGFALLGLGMRMGGLMGSLATGALIGWLGSGVAYLAVAAGYLASALVMRRAAAGQPSTAPSAETAWQNALHFLAAVRHHRVLPLLMVITAAAEIFGFSHQALLPSLARDVLEVGPEGLGTMTAARSVGGILGIAFVSGLGQVRGNGALFLAVLLVFGASQAALGFAPGFAAVVLILVVVNALGAAADILSQSLIQLAVPSGLRGRAGGAWVVAVGTAPLGQIQIGALASLVGVSLALALSGGALMLVAIAGALLTPRLRHL
jgi:MFS family permease